jgi:mono/diheme cytochrome c family protein
MEPGSKAMVGRVFAGFIFAGFTFIAVSCPLGVRMFRAVSESKIEHTAEQFARGKYLAENVSGCMECHTPHDWSARVSPLTAGKLGAGEVVPLTSVPGHIVAPNITPDPETGAGNWTDRQLGRAIREGIGHDGRALFPAMPYQRFHALSDEDLAAIIVYLRSLPPVRNALPRSKVKLLAGVVVHQMPKHLDANAPAHDLSTPEKRGAYLAAVAACEDCHTPMNSLGQRQQKMSFGGGFILAGPFGRVASANLTPDPSGIPYYTKEIFIEGIRKGSIGGRLLNPVMPWTTYRGMTDEDLSHVFAYLRGLAPVTHRVDNTEAPSYCRLCKQTHGLGNRN